MTARWVVDVVAPERNLNITWQPISLLRKNEPDPDSEYYPHYLRTHKMLRVLESVRAADEADGGGNAGFFKLYWELGTRIHNDGDRDFAMEDVLESCGLDATHLDAWEDEAWDEIIATRMDAGLDLVGADVGTPIIAIDAVASADSGSTDSGNADPGNADSGDAQRLGIFGPVITKVPNLEDSLKLWDSVVTMTRIPGFWELKRTRTERPDFGDRPTSASTR